MPSQPTHTPDIGSQNGAMASVQSSFASHGTGPVVLSLASAVPVAVVEPSLASIEAASSLLDPTVPMQLASSSSSSDPPQGL
jgi:hypothetical protein